MPARTFAEQDAFLAIVYADEELLRAEFDAIIDACWSQPPPARPTRPDRLPTQPGRPCTFRQPSISRWPDRHGGHEWVRQRSPPPRAAQRPVPPTRPKG